MKRWDFSTYHHGPRVVALALWIPIVLGGCFSFGHSQEVHSNLRAGPGYVWDGVVYFPTTYRCYREAEGIRRFPDGGQSKTLHESTAILQVAQDRSPRLVEKLDVVLSPSDIAGTRAYRDGDTLILQFGGPKTRDNLCVTIQNGTIRQLYSLSTSAIPVVPTMDINQTSEVVRSRTPSQIGLRSPLDFVDKSRRRFHRDIVQLRGDLTYRREVILFLQLDAAEASGVLDQMERYEESLRGYARDEYRYIAQETRQILTAIVEKEE